MADYRLTQTGQQVQTDLNNAEQDNVTLAQHVANAIIHVTSQDKTNWNAKTTQAQVESLIAAAVANFVTGTQVQSAIATALDPYSTTAEVQLAIQNAITSALANYYTSAVINQMLSEKVNKVSGKQLSTEDFTTALKAKLDALPTAADLATQISTAISDAPNIVYLTEADGTVHYHYDDLVNGDTHGDEMEQVLENGELMDKPATGKELVRYYFEDREQAMAFVTLRNGMKLVLCDDYAHIYNERDNAVILMIVLSVFITMLLAIIAVVMVNRSVKEDHRSCTCGKRE